MSIFDAVDTLFDGVIVADVQHSQRKSFSVSIPGCFHQLILTFQITHGCYDCEQVEEGHVSNQDKQVSYYHDNSCVSVLQLHQAQVGLGHEKHNTCQVRFKSVTSLSTSAVLFKCW